MNMILRAAGIAAVALALGGSLEAQFESGSSLRGQINSGAGMSGLFVELYRFGDATPVGRADADMGGGFEFTSVPPGDYQVKVTDFQGNVVAEQMVHLAPPSTFVTVELPSSDVGAPGAPAHTSSGGGVVSLAELKHKVPGKAVKELEKATKAADKGDNAGSIAHLQKAIEIDPAYVEAYNNLGARYLRAQQFDQAAEQFQKALELDENCQPAASNLGLTYIAMKRFADAEKYARKAISLDATSNRARLVLGIALAAQDREPDEALQNLKAAARELPDARLALAQFLSDHGEKNAAASELRKYLQSPASEAQDRPKLEQWLSELEHE